MVVVTQRRRAQIAGPERVLTSYHVVEGASKIKVTVAETGKTYQATVVGSDQTADEALLQVKGAGRLATIKIDNDKISVGDKVIEVGNAQPGICMWSTLRTSATGESRRPLAPRSPPPTTAGGSLGQLTL